MDVPIRPGDLLSQPTRARLFELLGELARPATTEELAGRLGLHPNGVRLHLERLHHGGLIERRRERITRGRPRDAWAVSSDAQPGGDPPSGYAELSRWLIRALVEGGIELPDVERAGFGIGQSLARASAVTGADGYRSAEQQLFDELAALGFQPERKATESGHITYRLRNCPYREAVRERQSLVCGLHRGLTRGLLATIEPGSELTDFEAKDPELAGCLVGINGALAGTAAAPERKP